MDFAGGVHGYETFLTAAITRNLSGKGEPQLLFDIQGHKRSRQGLSSHTDLLQLWQKKVIKSHVSLLCTKTRVKDLWR